MYYVYDRENLEFKHVIKLRNELIVNHELLKVYRPSVDLSRVKGRGITECMVLSHVYHNLKGDKAVPLHYPLVIAENQITGDLIIKDSNEHTGWLMGVKPDKLKATKIESSLSLTLPVKLGILDSFIDEDCEDEIIREECSETEVCNDGFDNDCNGIIDENCNLIVKALYDYVQFNNNQIKASKDNKTFYFNTSN